MMGTSSGRRLRALPRPHLWPSLLAVLALALGSLAGPATVSARQQTGLDFSPIGGSRVTGYAPVTADGQGTNISIRLAGLGSSAPTQAALNAGRCAQPSADALWTLNLQWVDERGRGDGSGTISIGGRPMSPTSALSVSCLSIGGSLCGAFLKKAKLHPSARQPDER